ncbi:hypothetical protein Tco_1248893 [Tanacetum coccineum]
MPKRYQQLNLRGTASNHSQTSLGESGDDTERLKCLTFDPDNSNFIRLTHLVLDKIVEEKEIAEDHPLVISIDDVDLDVGTNIYFMSSGPTDMTLDNVVSSSELSSMPDDDLHSVLAFDTIKSGDDDDMAYSRHMSKEGTTDTLFNAFAKYHSLSGHLDYVYEEDSMPTLISNSLRAQLPGLLADALKDSKSERFVTLQKVLTNVLRSEMEQSVTSKVCSGMQESAESIPSSKLLVENQGEQPAEVARTNEGKELVVHKPEEKKLKGAILVEDDSDEDDLDKQPLSKRFKIETPFPNIENPIPLSSFIPEHLLNPEEKSLQDFTDQLFKITSSKFSPTPPRDSFKEGPLSQEKINEQLRELKRLADLKAEQDKSEQELRKMFNQATLKAHA